MQPKRAYKIASKQFSELKNLLKEGGAFEIESEEEVANVLQRLNLNVSESSEESIFLLAYKDIECLVVWKGGRVVLYNDIYFYPEDRDWPLDIVIEE